MPQTKRKHGSENTSSEQSNDSGENPPKKLKTKKSFEKETTISKDIKAKIVFDPALTIKNGNSATVFIYDAYKKKHSSKKILDCIQKKLINTKNNSYGLKKRLLGATRNDGSSITLNYHNSEIIPAENEVAADLAEAFSEKPLFCGAAIGKNLKSIIDEQVFLSITRNDDKNTAVLALKDTSLLDAKLASKTLRNKIQSLNTQAGEFYISKARVIAGAVEVTYVENTPNEFKTLKYLIEMLEKPSEFYYKLQEKKQKPSNSTQGSPGRSSFTMYGSSNNSSINTTSYLASSSTSGAIVSTTITADQIIPTTIFDKEINDIPDLNMQPESQPQDEIFNQIGDDGELNLKVPFEDLGFNF